MSDAFSNKKVSVIYRITEPFVMIFPMYLAALLVFQRKLDQILRFLADGFTGDFAGFFYCISIRNYF